MNSVQNGGGWSGFLVLHGKFDVAPIYRQMLIDQQNPYSAVFGNTQHGTMEYKEVTTETMPEMAAHIGMKLPIKPFSMLIVGDMPNTTAVPSRNTTISVWSQGHINGTFQRATDLIIDLNKDPIPKKVNYTRLIRERVIEPLEGKFAMCLGYFSKHPRIILATRHMELYTWIVFYNGVYLYVWSTDSGFLERVKQSLDQERRNELFELDVHLDNRSLIVIHPMFWITKFDKVLKKLQGRTARLLIISYFSNYLKRSTITRAELLSDEDVNNQ